MQRRAVLFGGVAAAAAAAGAAWAWLGGGPGDAAAVQALWAQRFERPEGGELALAALRGRPVLVNFWATWCPPCVTEMPLLDAFHAAQSPNGWRVLGLAVDGPTPVREFLRKKPMRFDIGLAGLSGVDLARSLGNRSGALPFSVALDRSGRLIERKLGALHPADLDAWVRSVG